MTIALVLKNVGASKKSLTESIKKLKIRQLAGEMNKRGFRNGRKDLIRKFNKKIANQLASLPLTGESLDYVIRKNEIKEKK